MTDGPAGDPPRGDDATAALRDRVLALVGDWEAVEAVTMFGLPSFTAQEELFCVVSEQGLSLTRLPPPDREVLETLVDVHPFEADGRTIDRWATVAPDDLPDDETLRRFLRASYEAAKSDAV